MDDMSATHARPPQSLRKWQSALVGMVTCLTAVILISYGAAASYESLSRLALAHGVPLARFFPVGLDGGLIGTIVMDIGLTWCGFLLGWLRLTARLFALATVAFNAVAGWPDPVGVFLRVCAPVLIVVIAEAVRAVLLRRARGTSRDPVPASRWVLAPRGTWKMYKRMKLWEIPSYRAAVSMELERLNAVHRLSAKYGKDWRGKVPGDLAWMLTDGVRMEEALRLAGELTALPQAPARPVASRAPVARKAASGKRRAGASGRDIDTQAEALALYLGNPEITGSDLGRALRLSPSRGRAILATLKSEAPATGPIARVSD